MLSAASLRVAVFGGHGTAGPWHGRIDHGSYTVDALKMLPGVDAFIVKADDYFVTPAFNRDAVDIVWFPGGGAHAYGNVIGDRGIAAIRYFVASGGGGYIGACAGAYFASSCVSSTPPHGRGPPCAGPGGGPGPGAKGPLRFLNADTLEPFNRGDGYPSINITAEGRKLLNVPFDSLKNVTYADGPMLIPMPGLDKNYEELAHFTSEVNTVQPARTRGQMLGKPAVVWAKHGNGTALATVVHAELSIGDRSVDTPNLLKLLRGFLDVAAPR